MTTVLIVEDDEPIRAMLRTWLEGEGYAVAATGSGAQVVPLVEAQSPDVLLLDLMLPERDGVSLLVDLAQVVKRPPVLVISAYASQAQGEALVAPWPETEYLAKPLDLVELSARVQAMTMKKAQERP